MLGDADAEGAGTPTQAGRAAGRETRVRLLLTAERLFAERGIDAVSARSHAVRLELAGVGIKVTVVEPGGFRTEWAGSGIRTSARAMGEYASATQQVRAARRPRSARRTDQAR